MDKYGYLINPEEISTGKKKWFWLAGGLGAVVLVYWLINRTNNNLGRIGRADNSNPYVIQYTVTAPVTELQYEGAGMPFNIKYYEYASDYYMDVDNNGIARLRNINDVPGGFIRTVNGELFFVSETELNDALDLTRQRNADILLTVTPYSQLGPGYLGYCTSGPHIGKSVYITLAGQIGMALNKAESGDLYFVPLDVIDQSPDIWSTYIKPGGK